MLKTTLNLDPNAEPELPEEPVAEDRAPPAAAAAADAPAKEEL